MYSLGWLPLQLSGWLHRHFIQKLLPVYCCSLELSLSPTPHRMCDLSSSPDALVRRFVVFVTSIMLSLTPTSIEVVRDLICCCDFIATSKAQNR